MFDQTSFDGGPAPPSSKLTVLDLFSGIGGFSLGLERTGGFETVAFCENNRYAQFVLNKHWPDVPCFDDVTGLNRKILTFHGIYDVDVICGGFPCQDISDAGNHVNRAGIYGQRSKLWFEFARLIGQFKPRFVIAENVPALRARGLDALLMSLVSIGYDAEWHCIPASSVGAAQKRDRLWIVAYPKLSVANSNGGVHKSFGNQTYQSNKWEWSEIQSRITRAFERSESYRWWHTEPDVARMVDGVPYGMDRLRCLGNAVVPQIPELIGNAILDMVRDGSQTQKDHSDEVSCRGGILLQDHPASVG